MVLLIANYAKLTRTVETPEGIFDALVVKSFAPP